MSAAERGAIVPVMWRYSAVGAVCLLVGFVAGRSRPLSVARPSTQVAVSVPPVVKGAPAAIEPVARATPPMVDAQTVPIGGVAMLKAMRAFGERTGTTITYVMFDPNKHLSASAKSLLDITEGEERSINAIVDSVEKKIQEVELKLATARRDPTTGEVVISVPAYPEAAAQLFDELRRGVQNVLGAERYALMQQQGGGLEGMYQQLGLMRRELALTSKVENGVKLVSYREDQKLMAMDPSNRVSFAAQSQSGGGMLTRAELIKQFGPLVEKFLPQEP